MELASLSLNKPIETNAPELMWKKVPGGHTNAIDCMAQLFVMHRTETNSYT